MTKPDSYSHHEALHTSYLAMDLVDRQLMDHAAIKDDNARYTLAVKAHQALFDLYQLIGKDYIYK